MGILRFALAVTGIIFAAIIVWAIMAGNFSAAGTWLTTDPWGITTLFDLYFGFLLSAIIIALYERSSKALFWIIPIPFLGNVWVVIWFVLKLPDIHKRLTPQTAV